MPRSFRPVLAVLAALAVWMFAAPAFAAAPMCDDRGATGLAPAPTLDAPNASVDIGTSPDACGLHVERDASFHKGHAPDPLPSPLGADVLPANDPPGMKPPVCALAPREAAADASRSGIPSRLERPPRRAGA